MLEAATDPDCSDLGPDVLELVPEGAAPPPDLPAEVFEHALGLFLRGKRLDMRALAEELGIGRATLYRHAGNKSAVLGETIWYLTRRALIPAIQLAHGQSGADRVLAIMGSFMRFVHAQPGFQRLLEEEPEAALRILTSKEGHVQARLIEALQRLLQQEEERGNLDLGIDSATLAYVIVRIGESFLYADVIADSDPDIGQALDVIARLLENRGAPAV